MILNRKKSSFPGLGWVRWFPQRGATQRRLAMEGPDPGACTPSPIRPPEKERPRTLHPSRSGPVLARMSSPLQQIKFCQIRIAPIFLFCIDTL